MPNKESVMFPCACLRVLFLLQIQNTRKPSSTLDQEAVRAENCVEDKKRRPGFKAVLTKRRNELFDLMDRGENVDCVKLKVLDLNEAFDKFVDAHKLYCSYVDGSQSSVELAQYY